MASPTGYRVQLPLQAPDLVRQVVRLSVRSASLLPGLCQLLPQGRCRPLHRRQSGVGEERRGLRRQLRREQCIRVWQTDERQVRQCCGQALRVLHAQSLGSAPGQVRDLQGPNLAPPPEHSDGCFHLCRRGLPPKEVAPEALRQHLGVAVSDLGAHLGHEDIDGQAREQVAQLCQPADRHVIEERSRRASVRSHEVAQQGTTRHLGILLLSCCSLLRHQES
mmetsp:Transcript_74093/g.187955  ORF Transcript_74093/g.187955 Transcript_74093/m.187955 type:complete len:221 (-) Transcript_74093:322-984(-)